MSRQIKTSVAVAMAVFACATSSVADAHRLADRSERNVIAKAVVRQRQLSTVQASCQTITVSTVDKNWATLSWPFYSTMSTKCQMVAADGVIVEHKIGSSWRFVTAGSAIRCPVRGMPTAVTRDLRGLLPCAN